MNDMRRELDEAYKLLAVIPVAGDHVEVMAEAREHLRRAYKLAATDQKEAETDG